MLFSLSSFTILDDARMMHRRETVSLLWSIPTACVQELGHSLDLLLEFIYRYVELPLQKVLFCHGNVSALYYRQRSLCDFFKASTQILAQSYFVAFTLYFALLLFAQLFSNAIQRYYFLDPLLSNTRQCISIDFVRVNQPEMISHQHRLRNNFLRENLIIGHEDYHEEKYNDSQIHQLFDLLEDSHYMICQRSLYLHSRFHAYTSLLRTNQSQFRFVLPKYSFSFPIDRPPFLDLCLHVSNDSHLSDIKSRLLPLASDYYSSVNLFLFDFNVTQISITLYALNTNSTHLERVSIHTGWLSDMYQQFSFLKYDQALSTVLFDGVSLGHNFAEFYNYSHVPVPADPMLALNEMVQQALLVLPLCTAMSR